MTDALQKLFSSAPRVKLLRLFLFNPNDWFTYSEAANRAQTDEDDTRSEIKLFLNIGLLKRNKRGKHLRFGINESFPFLQALEDLLLNVTERGVEVRDRMKKTGAIKLVIMAGIFVGQWDSSIDLLLVGDRVRDRIFKKQIRALESEIGKEIRYVLLSNRDFFYRLNMSDKLMRDVFDYPHKIVLDRLDIGLK